MEINKKELKIISYEFRCIANRVINSNYQEAVSLLKMLMNYIDENSLIFDFIKSNITTDLEEEVKNDINAIRSNHGGLFCTGETQQDEISYTYQLLKYIVKNQIDYRSFTRGYTDSTKFQEAAKGFNNRVVLPFVYHIEGYLTKIGIQMGYDEERRFMITINSTNGQVNISQDNSTINAVQNQNVSASELEQLIRAIKEELGTGIGRDEQEIINDSVDCLQEELQKENPKKGLIKNCITGLTSVIENIPSAIGLCEKIKTLIEYVQQNISGLV